MHQLDDTFRQLKTATHQRTRRRARQRVIAGLAIVAGLCGIVGVSYLGRTVYYPMDEELVASPEMLAAEESAAIAATPYVPAIVNLAGDPLVISLDAGTGRQSAVTMAEAPGTLAAEGVNEPVAVLSDVMLSASERFMTALPSSPEDFAFFQAQREPPPPEPPASTSAGAANAEAPVAGNEAASAVGVSASGTMLVLPDNSEATAGAGWGEAGRPDAPPLPAFSPTAVENTTTVAFVVPETARFRPTEDIFVRVLDRKGLSGVLTDNGFADVEAEQAAEALSREFSLSDLEPGTIVAMRGRRANAATKAPALVQLSLYAADRYLASLAVTGDGRFGKAADPWVGEDLTRHFGEDGESAPIQRFRLIDAIYSTAARNSVPTSIIGEAIMHLSRAHDLNAFAEFSQRLVLVYSPAARDKESGAGRVLFAAVRGGEKDLDCFVYRETPSGAFGCVSELNEVRRLSVENGMVVPVEGVMTSTFGPRRHPILKVVRLHKGVDWAAPVGAPVVAAFAGTVAFAGTSGDYGNLVRLVHADGRETLYAHLSGFAPGLAEGQRIEAGAAIGTIGTTGLSTGPHLHFELHAGGTAIDPLGEGTAAAALSDDGGAVDRLVNRIIQVESGGRADAKNPLSSATGLGQFIDATWIRMMVTYRPDLGRTLPREDLLSLRNDPTLSRDMVRQLARENEASLRASGHAITAGRLYLAHFLGPEGANIVLSAAPDADLAALLGDGVVRANPFLTGQSAGYVVAWAERKMSGRRGSPPAGSPRLETKEVARASPAFEAYKKAVMALVDGAATEL